MKGSLLLLGCFALGIAAGWLDWMPSWLVEGNAELFVLYGLLLLVGIGIGCDSKAVKNILRVNVKALSVPALVVLGSLLGAAAVSIAVGRVGLRDSLAVGAGFGYYSLSSILISQIRGEELGVIALLSNIFREVLTILLTPLLAKYCGKLYPIACGGATSMDTTLPVIHRSVGNRYAVIAVINGAVLSMLVPFLVPILLS
jgi:uncharacterized membrane protein YbjE (DUF340 family)